MSSIIRMLCFSLVLFASYHADAGLRPDDIPEGFKDPLLLEKVMKGEIIIQDTISTPTEFRTIGRAFFKKVSPNAYLDLATNHPKYPDLFEEVKKGETLEINSSKTEFKYRLDILIEVGFLSEHVYPEGIQKLVRAEDAISESTVDNEITNYTQTIKFSRQHTRLIPYKDGMLVEDDVHFQLQKDSGLSGIIKQELKKFFTKYISRFRQELQGSY